MLSALNANPLLLFFLTLEVLIPYEDTLFPISHYKQEKHKKALNIVNDPRNPLWNAYQISGRSVRFITVRSKTERYKKSFVPATSRKLSE